MRTRQAILTSMHHPVQSRRCRLRARHCHSQRQWFGHQHRTRPNLLRSKAQSWCWLRLVGRRSCRLRRAKRLEEGRRSDRVGAETWRCWAPAAAQRAPRIPRTLWTPRTYREQAARGAQSTRAAECGSRARAATSRPAATPSAATMRLVCTWRSLRRSEESGAGRCDELREPGAPNWSSAATSMGTRVEPESNEALGTWRLEVDVCGEGETLVPY